MRSSLRFAFVSLTALAPLSAGCASSSSSAAPAPACENDAATVDSSTTPVDSGAETVTDSAAPAAREPLSWSVEFPTGGKLAEIPALKFRAASGLAIAQTEVVDATGPSLGRTITPFEGYAGETTDATALNAWSARIAAWTPCDACDPSREWLKASLELARPTVVSALTSDGQWLARWSMAEAWPADVFGGKRKDGRFELASFTLAGGAATFELNPENPWLAKVLKSGGLAPSKLPDATLGFGKAPDFALAALSRPFLGVQGVVDGLGLFAASTPLYAANAGSGDNPLFEGKDDPKLRTIEIRDGEKTLLRALGVKQELEIVEFKNGEDTIVRKRPGRAKFKNLVLRSADVIDPSVLGWLDANVFGKVERKSGSIVLVDREGNEVLRGAATNMTPSPSSVVPSRFGPTDWTAPEAAARWQRSGIGHTIVVKVVADAIELK